MEDCIFCKIIAGEIPSTKVWEDDNFFAFKDINPVAPVHVLVIPKKHIQSIAALTPDDADIAGKMLYAIQKVAQVMNLSLIYTSHSPRDGLIYRMPYYH